MPDASDLDPKFPLEFTVEGTPLAHGARREAIEQWKQRVKDASSAFLPEGHWASWGRIAVTIFYFPDGRMDGDVDNIVKWILDAMKQHIYMDDRQVERVVVQKFEPGAVFAFTSPSKTLADAVSGRKPLVYIRVSNDPFEELR